MMAWSMAVAMMMVNFLFISKYIHFDEKSYQAWTLFELHGSQSMPSPLAYFHYLIGPMLLWKTWVQRAPHLFFCNSITVLAA